MPKNNRKGKNNNNNKTCYNCGLRGHTARTCKTDALYRAIKKINETIKPPGYNNMKQLADILWKTSENEDQDQEQPNQKNQIQQNHNPKLDQVHQNTNERNYISFWNQHDFDNINKKIIFDKHKMNFSTFRRLRWEKKLWYNDSIISLYLELIVKRSAGRIFAMNTDFMTKVMSTNDASVHRWTSKLDIFFLRESTDPSARRKESLDADYNRQ